MHVYMCNDIHDSQKHCSHLKSRFAMFVHVLLCFLWARCLRHWIWIWAVASRQAAMFVGDLESSADFGGFNETRPVAASCTKYCRRIIILNLVLWLGWTWLNVQMPGCGDGCTWISGSSFGCKLFQCACHGLILHMLHVIVYSICIDIYLYMWVCFFLS